jgi:hypothetical protein
MMAMVPQGAGGGGGLRLDGIPDASTNQVHGLGDQGVGHSGCPESLGGYGSDEWRGC